jgi:hypothetical protein
MPADICDPVAVLDWIVSRRVHAYLDTAGRPVGEGRSAAIQDVKTEMRTCPYPGSRHRHEKPMNASALQGMPPWPGLLAIMAWLGHRHRQRFGVGVTNSNDLARITSAGIMLVDYLALRRQNPIGPDEVPLLVSGVYKVCLGYQLAYLPERFSDDAPAELPDTPGFLDYLETAGLLIGEAEVCSCPPALIVQSYEAITRAGADVSAPQIDGWSIDWDRFDDFAEGAGDMWRELVMFAIRMPSLIPQLAEAALPDTAQARLNALLAERGKQLLDARDGLVAAIAESVRAATDADPAPLPAGAEVPRAAEPGSVAATIIAWLREAAPADMAAFGAAVESALVALLGPYEDYEAGVLARINASLARVMRALELGAGPALTRSALSQLCGRTLRDWAAPGSQP